MILNRIKLSITAKLIVVFFSIITLFCLCSYIFCAIYMVRYTEKKVLEGYRSTLTFTGNQLERVQQEIEQYAAIILADTNLQELTGEVLEKSSGIKQTLQIHDILRDYRLIRKDCLCIELILENGNIYTSDTYDKDTLHLGADPEWYEKMMNCSELKQYSEVHDISVNGISHNRVVTYCSDVSNYRINRYHIGKLLISFNAGTWDTLVNNTGTKSSWSVILNHENDLIASRGIDETQLGLYLDEIENEREMNDGWLLSDPSLSNGVSVLVFMPKTVLHEETLGIRTIFFIMFGVCVILTIALIIPISRIFTKRIRELGNAAARISDGDFDTPIEVTGKDEVAILARSFNKMSVSISKQMQELKRAEREKADLKMGLLMGQINPHFIYNTLDAAIYLSRSGDSEKAARVLQLFVLLLQSTIKSGPDGMITSVSQEIEDLNVYIGLQKIRYPERFEFSFLVEEGLENVAIPKLLLQPLVENALNHGILPNEFGTVTVSIREDAGWLCLSVADDGEGMTAEELSRIQKQPSEKKPRNASKIHSIGIYNICQRLELMYKDRYELDLKSEPGKGTTVIIRFPMKFSDD